MARRDSRTLKDEAAAARDKGKHKQALKSYLALESLEPADGEWSRRAAEMHRRLGKNADAIAALERATDKYIQAGFLVKASAACRMILQMDPGHELIRERLESLDAERTGVGLPARFGPGGGMPTMPPDEDVTGVGESPATMDPTRESPRESTDLTGEGPTRVAPGSLGVGAPDAAALPNLQGAADDDDIEVLSDDALEELDLEVLADEDDAPDAGLDAVPTQQRQVEPVQGSDFELDVGAFDDAGADGGLGDDATDAGEFDFELGASGNTDFGLPAGLGNVSGARASTEIDEDDPLAGLSIDLAPSRGAPAPSRPAPQPTPRPAPQPAPQPAPRPAPRAGGIARSQGERAVSALSADARRILQESAALEGVGADVVQRLTQAASPVRLDPGQVLFREGAPGDALYMVTEGAVMVISEGPPQAEIANLGPGEIFGEVAVLTGHARTATIQAHARSGAQIVTIARDAVTALFEQAPALQEALQQLLRSRLVDRLTSTSPLFLPFIGAERRDLASRFRFLEVRAGDRVMEQGTKARGFFVLLGGRLETLHGASGQERVVGTLAPGDMCGEASLLDNAPAQVTVRAASNAFVLEMPAQVFREIIMTHPQVLMVISDLADAKREQLQQL